MYERARRSVDRTASYASGLVRKHRPDYTLITYMSVLLVVGLIIIFSISPQTANVVNESSGSDISSFYFVTKQVVSVLIALAAFIICAVLIPFELLKRHAFKIFLFGLGACALLFVLGNILHVEAVAQCSLGACRWFKIPGFGTLQPAEFLKFGLLLYLPSFLALRMKNNEINDVHKTIIPLSILFGISELFIVVIQKDLGTGIALLAIVSAMIVATNMSVKLLSTIFGTIAALGVLMIIMAPHRIERVMTFIQGDSVTMSDPGAYHILNAKIAIGSGGLTGAGIGNSVQAAGYLPEAINDSVFAILGETFGFIGLMFIVFMFFMLLVKLLSIASLLHDYTYKLTVVGVFGWVFAHVVINIGAMTGLIPLTGITLPFLSFGGTSILFISLALGLVLQLSQYTSHDITKGGSDEDSSSRRRIGRSRYASRRGHVRN